MEVSSEIVIYKKNHIYILELKNIGFGMNISLDACIRRLDTTENRCSELGSNSVQCIHTEAQRTENRIIHNRV